MKAFLSRIAGLWGAKKRNMGAKDKFTANIGNSRRVQGKMRTIKLFLGLFLTISFHGYAQKIDFSTEVATYLQSNGTLNPYDFAYDELLKMSGKQYPKSEGNAKGLDFLVNNKQEAGLGVQKGLIPIYQQNFEHSEIKEMTAFYQSSTGKQLTTDPSQMTEA